MDDAGLPLSSVGWRNHAHISSRGKAGRAADGPVDGHGRGHRRGHFAGDLSYPGGDGEVAGVARSAGRRVVRHGHHYAGRRALLHRTRGAVSAGWRRICLPAPWLRATGGVSLWMDGRGGHVSRRGGRAQRGLGALCAGSGSLARLAGAVAACGDSAGARSSQLRGNPPEHRRDDHSELAQGSSAGRAGRVGAGMDVRPQPGCSNQPFAPDGAPRRLRSAHRCHCRSRHQRVLLFRRLVGGGQDRRRSARPAPHTPHRVCRRRTGRDGNVLAGELFICRGRSPRSHPEQHGVCSAVWAGAVWCGGRARTVSLRVALRDRRPHGAEHGRPARNLCVGARCRWRQAIGSPGGFWAAASALRFAGQCGASADGHGDGRAGSRRI